MIISAFLPMGTCLAQWQWHNATHSWVGHWFHYQQNTHPYAHACFMSYLNFKQCSLCSFHLVFINSCPFLKNSLNVQMMSWHNQCSSLLHLLLFKLIWCSQDTCMTLRERLVFWWHCLSPFHTVMTSPQLAFWLYEFVLKMKNIVNS
jgi:hypothetical protein